MFEPFEDTTDFYPGLIVWCDPTCYEPDSLAGNLSTHSTKYDRRKSRELRPCLVISVNHSNHTFQAARLSATTPDDPSKWARIDSPPPITWKLNDAWIWVATPPTIAMVFDRPKVMHPNKDAYYSTHPVATINLQNYNIHRQAYINRQSRGSSVRYNAKSTYPEHSVSNNIPYYSQPPSALASPYASPPPRYQQQLEAPPSFNQANPYSRPHQTAAFESVTPHPVVVPFGFTESRPDRPGWWRNPETGYFWHAGRGFLPPN
ncbi:hypothetical protein DFH06DRAFT_1334398 [Mycena polygramma]|nr:hypothetical protein DFH06DRAFT_1334398 [Mycena polygramma]